MPRRCNMSRRFGALTGTLLGLTLAVAACSSSGSSSSSTTPSSGNTGTNASSGGFLPASLKGAAPSSVKIGLAGGYALNFSPVVLADSLGYYDQVAKRFNTSISLDVYGGGTLAEPAFLGGTDQFMTIGTNSWLPVVLQGKDQVGIFAEGEGIGIEFAAAMKYKNTYGTDVSKFKGVTWCQTGPVGTAHTAILLDAGLNHLTVPASNIVSVGSVTAYTPALSSGRCGIAAEDLISAATQVQQNVGYILTNTNDPAQAEKLAGHQLGIPLTTSRKFASQYPQLTQAIVDATLKSLLYIQQNLNDPALIYSKLPAAAKASYTPTVFSAAWNLFKNTLSPQYTGGGVTQQQGDDTAAMLIATTPGLAGATVDPDKVWWNKFAYQAYKDLGVQQPSAATFPADLTTTLGPPSAPMAAALTSLKSSG